MGKEYHKRTKVSSCTTQSLTREVRWLVRRTLDRVVWVPALPEVAVLCCKALSCHSASLQPGINGYQGTLRGRWGAVGCDGLASHRVEEAILQAASC